MTPRIVVERAGDVPRDADVRHVDELDPDAQAALPRLTDGHETVSRAVAESFECGELVKFTDYYRVHCE